MPVVTALIRDQCPSCGKNFPLPFPDFQTARGGFFGPTFYHCVLCNSFSRYSFRWRSECWAFPVSAGVLFLLLWLTRTTSTLIPFRESHPEWYGAILGVFAGCIIVACIVFAFRTSFEFVTVSENEIPISKLSPVLWRLIDYFVLSALVFCYAFYRQRWGCFSVQLSALRLLRLGTKFSRGGSVMPSNERLETDIRTHSHGSLASSAQP